MGFILSSVIVCHGERFGRRILPVFFSLLMFSFGWRVYLHMRSVTRRSIKNGSWCDIVAGVAAVHARARAEFLCDCCVFNKKHTLCLSETHCLYWVIYCGQLL
jgi:hypothetical protein